MIIKGDAQMAASEPIRINVQLLSLNRKNDRNSIEKFRHRFTEQLPDRNYRFTKESRLRLTATFGIKKRKDIDNCLKVIQDELMRKYHFDDSQIYEINITKKDVKTYSQQNQEFIEFTLEKI